MAIEKTDKIWHNGKLINWDDATIHVMSHVIHYGSSVFEGIRCYELPTGPAIFRAEEHMQRLLDSAKVYRIDVDFTREQLVKGMLDTVGHNGAWPCYVRPIVLRGYGEAGVNPFNSPTEVYIINYPWGKYLGGEVDGFTPRLAIPAQHDGTHIARPRAVVANSVEHALDRRWSPRQCDKPWRSRATAAYALPPKDGRPDRRFGLTPNAFKHRRPIVDDMRHEPSRRPS